MEKTMTREELYGRIKMSPSSKRETVHRRQQDNKQGMKKNTVTCQLGIAVMQHQEDTTTAKQLPQDTTPMKEILRATSGKTIKNMKKWL